MLQLEERHQKIVKEILAKYPYIFYAYGSRTKGDARKLSDLDLCYQEKIPWNVLNHLQDDFEESDLPFKVDLVAWSWMSNDFRQLIQKDLILVITK